MKEILIQELFEHNGFLYEVEYVIADATIVAALTEKSKQEKGVLPYKFVKRTDGLHFVPIIPNRLDESVIEELKIFLVKHTPVNSIPVHLLS